MEIRLERLVGRSVEDSDGRAAGRIEEIVARRRGRDLLVVEYQLGAYAWLHRLAGGAFWRAMLGVLPLTRPTIYRVPWHAMDLREPDRPRLVCRREDLETAA